MQPLYRRRRCREQIREFSLAIQDRRGFAETLAGDIAKLEIALQKEPWLMGDFQVIVDPDGHVNIIDLTRKFKDSTWKKRHHQQWLERIVNSLKSIVSAISAENIDEDELVESCPPVWWHHSSTPVDDDI